MKKLIFKGEIFEAEKITKTDLNITGYDINGNEIFLLRGISDFSQFQLKDDNGNSIDFPAQPPTAEERLSAIEDTMLMLI